jgi:hypothetical protein
MVSLFTLGVRGYARQFSDVLPFPKAAPVSGGGEMKPSTRQVVSHAPAKTVRIINLRGILSHPVEAESSLEADFIRRVAFSPPTVSVVAQPFVLPVSPRGYTPDFFPIFLTANPKVIVEVKLSKKIAKYADLFDRSAEFLLSKGFTFYVVTERELRKKKIHERALLIRRYAKAIFSECERQRVSNELSNYPSGLPLGSLIRKAKVCRELVIHMIAWKTVTTGPKLNIDDSAVVTLRAFAEKSHAINFERWFDIGPWGSNTRSAGETA